jgi:hypothetical protein
MFYCTVFMYFGADIALQMEERVTAISGGLSSLLSALNRLATPMSVILP